ncbi:GerMN domain-containing protein [Terrilactibacillus sp. S3-3]|nr:GerMN domain-containing protein [Terrilactibacillus sp. S3-3]
MPNGFSAVLPAGTTVKSVDLHSDGTLVANFSKDLLDYKASEEQAILQSITWTLTQFKDIKRVQIEIDGKRQVRMPIDNTEIGSGLTRSDGINTNLGNVVDVAGSESVTLYYLSVNKGHEYYVPVTTRIKTGGGDDLTNVVNALIIGPTHDGLTSTFGSDVALLAKPVIKNGIVTLNFNEALFIRVLRIKRSAMTLSIA